MKVLKSYYNRDSKVNIYPANVDFWASP